MLFGRLISSFYHVLIEGDQVRGRKQETAHTLAYGRHTQKRTDDRDDEIAYPAIQHDKTHRLTKERKLIASSSVTSSRPDARMQCMCVVWVIRLSDWSESESDQQVHHSLDHQSKSFRTIALPAVLSCVLRTGDPSLWPRSTCSPVRTGCTRLHPGQQGRE